MTIKDLANRTGYAVGTVSRALNDHPNVSPKARQAILEAARECGFQLNANAKQLKQQHSTAILVVVKGIHNELFGALLEAIQTHIAQTSYQLVVDYLDEDGNEVRRAAQLSREKKPLGILFLGGNTRNFQQDFAGIDVPCVLVTGDASSVNEPNLSSVSTDDLAAAEQAIDQLVALGHRDFAMIGGDRAVSDASRLRFEGCVRSFRAHGIGFDPEGDYQGVRYSCRDGYLATQALLARGKPCTAIFASADVLAIGAIRALTDAGLRVPEDVSVMGVDGLSLGEYIVPRLATVRQSVEILAQKSVEILLSGIRDGAQARHLRAPFQVLCRESVRSLTGEGE